MSNFVYDGTGVPDGKSDARALPVPADQGYTAAEWNTICQALVDVQGILSVAIVAKGDLLVFNGSAYARQAVGADGKVLSANSAQATGLEWITPAAGTVTNVTGTAPISSSGGATPAISLDDTAVTPGSYTNASITVDAKGRLTAASSGSGGGGRGYYGDGSDGNATFDGVNPVTGFTLGGTTYTADRDVFLGTGSSTIANGVRVRMVTAAGEAKRLFCAGTITGAGTAQIDWNGNDASGATGGAQIADGVTGGGQAGGNGGTAGGAGDPGQSQARSAGGGGGAGGPAGGGGGGGGTGGTATALAAGDGGIRALPFAIMGHVLANATIAIVQGGAGGGGGGADGANDGGGGGGGGCYGVCAVRHLAGTLAIQCKGGAGANGTAGDAGAGGGGGGGTLALHYDTKTGGVTTSVSGGAGGTGSGAGDPGASGVTGQLIDLPNID